MRSPRRVGVVTLLSLLAALYAIDRLDWTSPTEPPVDAVAGAPQASGPKSRRTGGEPLLAAIRERRSDVVVETEGPVVHLLPDDLRGSRHQRFLVDVGADRAVLIAHNIDLAPRIEGLRKGDRVRIRGEFEWNDKGGVIHWTHHDPAGRRPGGWIEHRGRTYR